MSDDPVKLFWWRLEPPERLNFGDEVTPYIIKKLWDKESEWSRVQECDIVGAGSILELLVDHSAGRKIAVWGSGFIEDGDHVVPNNLEFYAVRGKKTRDRLPEGYEDIPLGDPAMLISKIFKPEESKSYKIGVLPHYADQEIDRIRELVAQNTHMCLINALDHPEKVARDINRCALVLSSSLHGLIVSDAYGVPNYWMKVSDNLKGGSYKFQDYFSSVDRVCKQIDVGRIDDDSYTDELISQYTPVRDIERIQANLIRSFPSRLIQEQGTKL